MWIYSSCVEFKEDEKVYGNHCEFPGSLERRGAYSATHAGLKKLLQGTLRGELIYSGLSMCQIGHRQYSVIKPFVAATGYIGNKECLACREIG